MSQAHAKVHARSKARLASKQRTELRFRPQPPPFAGPCLVGTSQYWTTPSIPSVTAACPSADTTSPRLLCNGPIGSSSPEPDCGFPVGLAPAPNTELRSLTFSDHTSGPTWPARFETSKFRSEFPKCEARAYVGRSNRVIWHHSRQCFSTIAKTSVETQRSCAVRAPESELVLVSPCRRVG